MTASDEGGTTPFNDTNDGAQFLPVTQLIGSNDSNEGGTTPSNDTNDGVQFLPVTQL
ncbi:unnamed protein product, partial [Staurois parvus]